MKKILVVGIAVAALAVVAAVVLLGNLGAVVRAAVERFGSEATGTAVRLDAADISLKDGRGTLRGLTVGNPPGYASAHAFSLGEVTLEIDPSTATADVVVIRRIVIAAPQVTWELDAKLRSNVGTIEDHVKAYAGGGGAGGGGGGGAKRPSGGGAPGDEKRFIVDEFTVTGGRITLAAPQGAKVVTADMPAIRLRDLGRDRGGLTAAELAAEAAKALTRGAAEGAAAGGIEGAAKGLFDRVKGALEGVLPKR